MPTAKNATKNKENNLKQTLSTKKNICDTSCDMSNESSTKSKNTSTNKNPARIVIHYDCGFSNSLYVRGNGGKLNWNKGIPMKNQGPNTWIWECNSDFDNCEFKVLLNDQVFESGNNHCIKKGASCEYTPHFDYNT